MSSKTVCDGCGKCLKGADEDKAWHISIQVGPHLKPVDACPTVECVQRAVAIGINELIPFVVPPLTRST